MKEFITNEFELSELERAAHEAALFPEFKDRLERARAACRNRVLSEEGKETLP